MRSTLELRFVPAWLSNVFKHYDCDVENFDSIVSKHDMNMYRLANYLLRAKLRTLMVDQDYVFPDAEIDFKYDAADALFALYGQNPNELTVPQFELKSFRLRAGAHGDVWVIEDNEQEPRNLIGELLEALNMYKGSEAAYGSSTFVRYLSQVKNEPLLPAAAEPAVGA